MRPYLRATADVGNDTFPSYVGKGIAERHIQFNTRTKGERKEFPFSLLFFGRVCADVGRLYPANETLLSLHHVPLSSTAALAHWDETISLG